MQLSFKMAGGYFLKIKIDIHIITKNGLRSTAQICFSYHADYNEALFEWLELLFKSISFKWNWLLFSSLYTKLNVF